MDLTIKSSASFDKTLSEDNLAAFIGKVSKICLENVEFTDERVSRFADIANKFDSLEALEINGSCKKRKLNDNLNHQCEVPLAGLAKILGALSQLPHLRILRIKSHYLGGTSLEVLLPCISGIQTLELLDISANNIGKEGLIAVGESLVSMPNLRKIRMEQNSTLQNTIHIGDVVQHLTAWKALDRFRKRDGCTLVCDSDVSAVLDEMVVKLEPERILDIASDEDFDKMLDGSEGSLAMLKDVAVLSCKQMSWTPRRLERLSTGLNSMSQLLSLTMDGFEVDEEDETDKSPCSDYAIGESGMETIAASLQPLTGIQELRIRGQSLRDDDIRVLGDMIPSWTNLQVLDLSGNAFGVAGLEQLPLNDMHRLKVLDLSRNDFDHAGIQCLARKLAVMEGLEELYLGWCSIGDQGAEILSKSLGNLGNLKVLEMRKNKIGNKSAAALAPALGMMTQLQTLNLRKNLIGDEGAVALAPALEKMTRLQSLDLNCNQLGGEGAVALARAIGSLTELQVLEMGGNNIGDKGAVALAPALGKMTQLQTLHLHENKIGDQGAVALAPALGKMTRLQELSLHWNRIGGHGGAALAPALGNMTQLKTLHLHENKIGDQGAAALAPALGKMTELQRLNLHKNKIGDQGAVALAPALGNMTQLQRLNLDGNNIGGATALAPALGNMTQLQELSLRSNRIGAEGATALAPALGMMTQLRTLYLHENEIEDEGAAALAPVQRAIEGRGGDFSIS